MFWATYHCFAIAVIPCNVHDCHHIIKLNILVHLKAPSYCLKKKIQSLYNI